MFVQKFNNFLKAEYKYISRIYIKLFEPIPKNEKKHET